MSYPMMFASVPCISFVLSEKCDLYSLQKVSYALDHGLLRSHTVERQDKQL